MIQQFLRCGVVLLLVACNLSTTAAPRTDEQQPNTTSAGSFSAYLYSPQRSDLLLLNADGTSTRYNLGLPADTYTYSSNMSFSDDGRLVAYCTIAYVPNSPVSTATLYVRDIAAQSNLLTLDLGSNEGKFCSVGKYSLVGNQLALSLMNYAPYSANPDTSQPVWEVRIVEITTGETLHEINADMYPLDDLSAQYGGMMTLPSILRYTGTDVLLAFFPFASEGLLNAPSFIWNVASGSLDAIADWGRSGMDALDTGELVYPDNDPGLPAGMPMGPMGVFNVLRAVDDGGEPRIIYHVADWLIGSARFINHGRQLALSLFPSYNPDAPDVNSGIRWIALDRSGSVTELFSSPYFAEVLPAPDGYIVLIQNYENGNPQQGSFSLTLVSGGVSTVLWEDANAGDASWELAWATPTELASDLPPFPTFTP